MQPSGCLPHLLSCVTDNKMSIPKTLGVGVKDSCIQKLSIFEKKSIGYQKNNKNQPKFQS